MKIFLITYIFALFWNIAVNAAKPVETIPSKTLNSSPRPGDVIHSKFVYASPKQAEIPHHKKLNGASHSRLQDRHVKSSFEGKMQKWFISKDNE